MRWKSSRSTWIVRRVAVPTGRALAQGVFAQPSSDEKNASNNPLTPTRRVVIRDCNPLMPAQ